MGKAYQKSLMNMGMVSGKAHCMHNGVNPLPVFLF